MGSYPTKLHHPLLNQLIHTHIFLIVMIYILFIFFFTLKGLSAHSFYWGIFLMPIGVLTWTLAEYFVHRFIFHGNLANRKFQYFMHGYHHIYPKDSSRYVLPLGLTFPAMFAVGFLFYFLFGSYGYFLMSGFILGYLMYDVTHYTIHRFSPKIRLGKFLKSYHFYHHFKNSAHCFGVSSPLWDHVFKTTNFDS